MIRDSKLEHLHDMGMPSKSKRGLLRKPKPMSRKEALAQNTRDNGNTSVRKASEVPGSINKLSVNRYG